MIKLSEILDPKCIKLELNAKRKKEVIYEMVELLFQAGKIKDPEELQQSLIEREKIGTTGIGGGIAIPHVMTDKVNKTVMAFGRKKQGVKFDAIDEQPVHLIFLLVGPKQDASLHLKILCKLSRFLHNTRFKKVLLEAEKEELILKVFQQQEKREG